MKNEKIISALNKLDPSEATEDEIFSTIKAKQNSLSQSKNKFTRGTGRIRRIFYKQTAAVAVMLCFALAVSATALIINRQYIPFKGFIENGGYEVYYTPEILALGKNATVETVTRVKDGKTSELSLIITDVLDKNMKIITEKHGEFELTPEKNYNYSSFGTMTKYSFDKEGGYSSYGYCVKNFPEINEFTLVNGDKSVEVKLVPSNPNDILTAESSGVKMQFYSMSKGSKVLAYEIEDNNFNVMLSFQDTKSKMIATKTVDLGHSAFKLYDESGNEIKYYGYDKSPGERCGQYIIFLRTRPEEKIRKISISNVIVDINTRPVTMFLEDNKTDSTQEYSIDVPVPEDGKEVIFENGGLVIYDSDGLTGKIESVTRKGNELTFYTKAEYNRELAENTEDVENIKNIYAEAGYNLEPTEDIENMYITLDAEFDKLMRGTVRGPGYDTFKYENLEDSVKLYMTGISYTVNGNWEICFD